MSNFTIDENGIKRWRNDEGELHRLDGPAIVYADGSKFWYVNGKLHRSDGPAFEGADGHKEWYVNNKRHRLDGPAVEWVHGYKEWWVDGEEYPEEQWKQKVKELKQQIVKENVTTIIKPINNNTKFTELVNLIEGTNKRFP